LVTRRLVPIEESLVPTLEDLEQTDLVELLGAARTGTRRLEPIEESLVSKLEDLEQTDLLELGAARTGTHMLEAIEESLVSKLEDLEQTDLVELGAPDKGIPGVPSALQCRHCPLRDSPSIVRGFLDIQSGFNRDFRISKRRMGTPVHVVQYPKLSRKTAFWSRLITEPLASTAIAP
jgi:hypothetical protein